MRPTLKDIAKQTGLSITTVSLVLNNKPNKISERSRKLILDTAREIGYSRNQLAVSLITKRSHTLGLILPDIRNHFFSYLAKGCEDACQQKGWTMVLCNTENQYQRDVDYLNVLQSKGIDGIIYCMSLLHDEKALSLIREQIQRSSLPFLLIDRSSPELPFPVIALDHVHGGYLAAKHLLSLGHRKIGCITGPSYLIDSKQRLEGYHNALAEFGVPFDKGLITEGLYDIESGEKATPYLLKQNVSAIFAYNDMMAYGAYRELRNQGLSIPNDISLMGYDDTMITELLEVPLSTIHQPIEMIGQKAANSLIDSIEENVELRSSIPYEPTLIIRKSTASPKVC